MNKQAERLFINGSAVSFQDYSFRNNYLNFQQSVSSETKVNDISKADIILHI